MYRIIGFDAKGKEKMVKKAFSCYEDAVNWIANYKGEKIIQCAIYKAYSTVIWTQKGEETYNELFR